MKMKRMPTHVGVFFREEFVERNRIKVLNPWSYMGITYCEYLEFLDGNLVVSKGMLLGLEEITGVFYDFWRNMQNKHDEWLKCAKATVENHFKDGVKGEIDVYFGGIECSQDRYEMVETPSSQPKKQKVYICIKLGEGVSHTSATYSDKKIAESVSQAWGNCPIVEAEVDI